MKAIGLNVIMAQAGFYVAAKKFTYKPYSSLFIKLIIMIIFLKENLPLRLK